MKLHKSWNRLKIHQSKIQPGKFRMRTKKITDMKFQKVIYTIQINTTKSNSENKFQIRSNCIKSYKTIKLQKWHTMEETIHCAELEQTSKRSKEVLKRFNLKDEKERQQNEIHKLQKEKEMIRSKMQEMDQQIVDQIEEDSKNSFEDELEH